MPDLFSRLMELDETLDLFKPTDPVQRQTGEIANAIIEEARTQHGGDPVVAVIASFEFNANGYVSGANAGTMRAVVKQLMAVTRRTGT